MEIVVGFVALVVLAIVLLVLFMINGAGSLGTGINNGRGNPSARPESQERRTTAEPH